MMLVIVAAFIMAAPLFATVYFKRRARWLRAAYTAWGLVEQAAQVLLEDRHLDSRLGDTVERLILSVGDGRLTRDFLIALALHKTRSSSPMTEFDEVFRQLNSEQYHRFLRFMVVALFYDSLRTSFSGVVLRRILYWLASTARDKSAKVNEYEVAPAMAAAGRFCHS